MLFQNRVENSPEGVEMSHLCFQLLFVVANFGLPPFSNLSFINLLALSRAQFVTNNKKISLK